MVIKSKRENIELELAEDNFWYQLAMFGNDDQNPFEPPEATRHEYWVAYFKVVEDLACGQEFQEHRSKLGDVQFASLVSLVDEFTNKGKLNYWNPPRKIDFSQVRFVGDVDFTNFTLSLAC